MLCTGGGNRRGVTSGVYTRVSYVQDYINDILSGGNGTSVATLKAFASKTRVTAAAIIAPAVTTQFVASTTDVPTGKERVLRIKSLGVSEVFVLRMKIVQIVAFASAASSVIHGNEYSTSASDSMKSTMFTTKEENRIKSGSSDATTKDYPYIASLRLEGLDTTFCSGTLISSQYILTAGHCIKTEMDVVIAHLGADFGSNFKGEQIKVISSYRHQTNLYDVGLLKLEKPSTLKTATLCAADGSDNLIGTKATALEWGMTEDGPLSHSLQEAHVSLISSAECSKQYSNINIEGMLCAGYGGVKDSCSGGNGGPLVTADDILIGFARSRGTCGANVGIYTRLTLVIEYVNAILSGGTGSSFTDSTVSGTQEIPIALSTTESTYTPTVARSIPGAITHTGSIAKSTVKESTSAVTPVAATSTPAGALASTTVGQMVPIASDCTFHRHLSEEPAPATEESEVVIEKDMNTAEKSKKIVHAVAVEADKELEMWSGDSSNDDTIADILRTKATAEEEEQELDEEIRKDKEEEEEMYEEEIEKIKEEEKQEDEQEKKEDDTSAKTSDKSSKKTSTKAKTESEEQEETTPVSAKATKKPAKKSKTEEEKEDKLEEAEAKEIEELLQEEEDEEEDEEKREADTSAKTSDKSSKKTSTKAKAESEEQEETTPVSAKATKKPAKKSKTEEEKEDKLEEAEAKEIEELLQEEEDEEEDEEKREADTSAKTSDKSSKKTSTKAKAESEEQEETTPVSAKATKKPAKKSKTEEEKEDKLEEAEAKEIEELLQEEEDEEEDEEKREADTSAKTSDKLSKKTSTKAKTESEEQEETTPVSAKATKKPAKKSKTEEEKEDKLEEAEKKEIREEFEEVLQEAEEEEEEEDEKEDEEDKASPPIKKPSKNFKSEEIGDAQQK
ncbi:unnamed protein product [Peronospora destructor]|uniref:Peptidase S1 domain-containing protein n=1 Tax=Peronospora destructor TaxID=86335 RepID=A0AAV0VBZ4_9STRA|nr:unnamed protein product [Peronospora destructor]